MDLLVKMGYGGSRKDAGEAIGRSGDDGIDGETLANLMIDYRVGVAEVATYSVCKLDLDYYEQ